MVPGTEDCISSAQFSSVAQLCLTFWNPMDCSTPGLPVHHQLPELTQTDVHRVSDAIQPSHPLSSPSPPCLQSFPASGSFQMSQFFKSGGQNIGVSALASVLPISIQDWLPLGWTGLISLLSKGISRVFYRTTVKSTNSLAFSLLSNLYITTGKTITLTIQIFVGKMIFLLFNMLSKLVRQDSML